MNLDSEPSPTIRPEPRLIDGYKSLATSTIGNVLDDLGLANIMVNLRPVTRTRRIVGPAFTVKEESGGYKAYSNADFRLGAVVDGAQRGDVIVIDNGGRQVSTWGGIAAFTAMHRGIEGLVVDGGVRDLDEMDEFGFTAFARHVLPLSGRTRVKILSINHPVEVDRVTVCPGDIIIGDSTGIVCVPRAAAEDVLVRSQMLDRQDKQALEEIRCGLGFTEALAKFSKL